jgi:hypothetical protein
MRHDGPKAGRAVEFPHKASGIAPGPHPPGHCSVLSFKEHYDRSQSWAQRWKGDSSVHRLSLWWAGLTRGHSVSAHPEHNTLGSSDQASAQAKSTSQSRSQVRCTLRRSRIWPMSLEEGASPSHPLTQEESMRLYTLCWCLSGRKGYSALGPALATGGRRVWQKEGE